nr:hypothetical protein [Streptomyces sp. MK7]
MAEDLTQPCQASCEQPGHMHLRDADGRRDLLLGLVVVEAQEEDAAFALRELPQRLEELHSFGDGLEFGVAMAQQLAERGQGPIRSLRSRVEGPRLQHLLGTDRLDHRILGQTASVRDLRGGESASTVPLFELPPHSPDLLPVLLHRSRQPNESRPVPQVTLQLSRDRRHRVGQEGVALIRVVAVDGLDQAHTGDLEEVVLLRSADAAVLACDPARQGDQRADGLLTGGLALPGSGVPADTGHELVDLRGRERADGW